MKYGALLLPLLFLSSETKLLRETNSAAATRRAIGEFERGEYEKASRDFAQAAELNPGMHAEFNKGTAAAAAGKLEASIDALTKATKDPALRTSALYNRANAYLTAQQYERAIADYEQVLRRNPRDASAKRNLEIALSRKQREDAASGKSQQKQQQAQQQQSGAAQQSPQPQQPQPSQAPPQPGSADVDALLESIDQQDREELERMNKARQERKQVGW